MMVRLERLAKAMNAVFIVTSQQNSNAIKEKRDVIEQSDVGGSLAIIQKSSVVTFITQKKLISNDDSEDDYLMQLQIPKNRITGSTFNYDPPLVRYDDNSKSYKDFEINFDDMPNYDASNVLASDIFGLGDIHA
jgi:replicative DNA helicase